MKFKNKGISTTFGLIIIIAFAVLATGGVLAWQNGWLAKLIPQKPVACTMEAKVCPNGSAVGRTGPNCEFATCPISKTDEMANWKIYTNEKYGFEIKYPIDYFFEENIDHSGYTIFRSKNFVILISPFNGLLEDVATIKWAILDDKNEKSYQKINFLGRDAYELVSGGMGDSMGYKIITKNQEYLYEIELWREGEGRLPEGGSLFELKNELTTEQNKMLSTFKFTK